MSITGNYEGSPHSSTSSDSISWLDDWPTNFDGTGLLASLRSGAKPLFRFNVEDIFKEIEANLGTKLVDVPRVGKGSNNFVSAVCIERSSELPLIHIRYTQGLHIRLANGLDILARIARADVNWPNYDGFTVDELVREAHFEAATYHLLGSHPEIMASRLLFYRVPVQIQSDGIDFPRDLLGRRLFVFEKAEGKNNVWPEDNDKIVILALPKFLES